MRLSDIKPGQKAVVLKVLGHGAFRKRIMEMGFVRGKTVSVLLNAPLQDPVKYQIMGYEVSLRKSEASLIEVITEDEAATQIQSEPSPEGKISSETIENIIKRSGRRINIALVGNPNSGKTSLFNAASGGHEHVGNYGGVTVDAKRGKFSHNGYEFIITDLPGTYALSAYSPEEVYVRRHIEESTPDIIVNVVAASNLERNLYLTTELIDMDCPMVIALNMYDELEASGATLNYRHLGELLGVPVVPTVSRSGKGVRRLFEKIIDVYENREPTVRNINITHNPEVETGIESLKSRIMTESAPHTFSSRYLAIKMLERDKYVEKMLCGEEYFEEWSTLRDTEIQRIERTVGEDIETTIASDKYGFISGALKETYDPGGKEEIQTTRIIDSFVTHKLFGFPIFIFFMWLMFEATFSLGAYPMEWIENGVAWLGSIIDGIMADGMLKDLIVDGILGGVGGVIVFLPNILILYLFISFMEDSGYMARAAFIMDKLMHRMGLHGKSFIPLLMGFGCNVPAIMATRSIESRSSRLITILINPFMSCSARLPIYVLLIGAFFPKHASLVFLGLYIFGIVVAVITARLLRRFYFKKDETPFVMELPPYRMPTLRSTLIHMWEKAAQYLRKMGGIILVASIAVWFLSYFPRNANDSVYLTPVVAETSVQSETSVLAETPIAEGDIQNVDPNVVWSGDNPEISQELLRRIEQQRNSYIGRLGQGIMPVMEPLGFNWRSSVSLLSGMAAKELIVSTLGVLYAETDVEENSSSLSEKLHAPDPVTGKPEMTPLSALSFLVFALLYFPCLAALIAIARESGSWKWALFSFVYNTVIAWVAAFAVYNIGSLFV